jgi:hypothetical protein
MSGRIKRSDYDEDFEDPEHIQDENERELLERRARNSPPKIGVNLTEVVGKIVAFVNVVNDPPEWQALEVRFTDGTLLHFEFMTTHTEIKPKYMEARRGDLELIRDYGILPVEGEGV